MSSFTDTRGDRWEVPFTIHQVLRVKSALGIDLAEIGQAKDPKGDFDKLAANMASMVNILFVCCERQAEARGVSDVEFAERMDLQVFGDALDAFTQGFVDFFLRGPAKDRARQILAKRAGLVGRQIATEEQKVLSALESFASASDSPASAGLTPGPSPSESSTG